MKIKDLLGSKVVNGDVGIEIELEANNLPHPDYVRNYWRVEADSSLRGESAEYVMRKPTTNEELDAVFGELQTAFNQAGTQIRPTYRAGIHVHVNVQDLTPLQLVTFVSAYLMMEEVLIRYCDKTRIGNHFCLRMSDASYLLDPLVEFIQREDIHYLNSEDLRYASINLTSLFKYGSVEFRALESTLDYQRIKVWAGVLTHLRDFAKTLQSPVDLLGQASVIGFEQFAPIILGKWFPHFKGWATEANIQKGIRNIQYAVYSRDWSQQNLDIFKKQNLFGRG